LSCEIFGDGARRKKAHQEPEQPYAGDLVAGWQDQQSSKEEEESCIQQQYLRRAALCGPRKAVFPSRITELRLCAIFTDQIALLGAIFPYMVRMKIK
jgi:hypothetical protein